MSPEHLDVRRPGDLIPHRVRWLDCEHADVEPVAEGSGEHTGSRADVQHRYCRRRAQVTPDRLAPLREAVAWEIAGGLVRRGGRLVVADPGQLVPPCWSRRL